MKQQKLAMQQLVLTLMRFLKNCKMSKSLCIAGKVMMSKDFWHQMVNWQEALCQLVITQEQLTRQMNCVLILKKHIHLSQVNTNLISMRFTLIQMKLLTWMKLSQNIMKNGWIGRKNKESVLILTQHFSHILWWKMALHFLILTNQCAIFGLNTGNVAVVWQNILVKSLVKLAIPISGCQMALKITRLID